MTDDPAVHEGRASKSTVGAEENSTTDSQTSGFDSETESVEQESTDVTGADGASPGTAEGATQARRSIPPQRLALIMGTVVVLTVGGLSGWLGYRAHQAQRDDAQRNTFMDVAQQGAVNLTTIDYQHAEADVQRVLDSATGEFYDDFSKRSQPFITVVKQTQAKSVGAITAAGLESETGNEARIIVAVAVHTTNAGAEQQPRSWRMRVTVQKTGADVKISNVGFVP